MYIIHFQGKPTTWKWSDEVHGELAYEVRVLWRASPLSVGGVYRGSSLFCGSIIRRAYIP